MEKILEIGIILDRLTVPLWVSKIVERFVELQIGTIKLIVLNQSTTVRDKGFNEPFFYRFHQRLIRLFRDSSYQKYQTLATTIQIQKIPILSIKPQSIEASSQINKNDLDIILNFSSLDVKDTDVKLARYGMWRFLPDSQEMSNSFLSAYWATVLKYPALPIRVICTNGLHIKNATIFEAWLPTSPSSIKTNHDYISILCIHAISRLIQGTYWRGIEYFNQQVLKYFEVQTNWTNATFQLPSNIQALKNMFLLLARTIEWKIRIPKRPKCFLQYRLNPATVNNSPANYRLLKTPLNRSFYTPFGLKKDNRIYVFAEEFIHRKNKGQISLLQFDTVSNSIKRNSILERKHHLSYPFIFKHEQAYFMILSGSESRAIDLYQCDEFPQKWRFIMHLMENIDAVNTTLFADENCYWLFTSVNTIPEFSDYRELNLFYSDKLKTTEWTPHPGNPISTDCRDSLTSGRIFTHQGQRYRPSLSCSRRHGSPMRLKRITQLDSAEYEEQAVSGNDGPWAPVPEGTRTFNFEAGITLIDVC